MSFFLQLAQYFFLLHHHGLNLMKANQVYVFDGFHTVTLSRLPHQCLMIPPVGDQKILCRVRQTLTYLRSTPKHLLQDDYIAVFDTQFLQGLFLFPERSSVETDDNIVSGNACFNLAECLEIFEF